MKVKSEREVAQSCPTPSDPMDYSLLGSSIHGIFQARVLGWGAITFSNPIQKKEPEINYISKWWDDYSKSPEENICFDINHRKFFLDLPLRVMKNKTKVNKKDLIDLWET